MKLRYLGLWMAIFAIPGWVCAQDIDMDDFFSEDEEEIDYTFATFKTTRLVNGHSIEQVAKGVLDFRISHRFGPPTEGRPFYNFLGLDQANIRLGFEYGLTNGIMVGIGRSKDPGKAYDGFVKMKLLRQSKGARKMPIALSYFGSAVVKTVDMVLPSDSLEFPGSGRWYYSHQLLIAKKFNERLSLQLTPTIVHRNLVKTREEANTVLALGAGGRYMITGGVSLNLEWFYVLPDQLADTYYNSFAIGFDIETGGHVFQLHFTNSVGMTEPAFVTETSDPFEPFQAPGIRFGFNLSRVFTMVSPH